MSWTEIMMTMYLLEKIAPLPELDARFGGGGTMGSFILSFSGRKVLVVWHWTRSFVSGLKFIKLGQ